MQKYVRGAAGGLCAAILCGCAPTIRQVFVEHALDRAAFEMHCSKTELELVQLDFPLDHRMVSGAHVGVKGCEKQSVYVYTNQAGWVLNSTSTP
jgi:hypothetical protein